MVRPLRTSVVALALLASGGAAWSQTPGPSSPGSEPGAVPQPVDERARAKLLAERGQDRFDAGDYPKALELFQQAESAFHAPTILLLIARTRARLGQRVPAARVYERIQREELQPDAPEAWRAAHELAITELGDLLKELGSVDVVVPTPAPGMVLTVGGQRITSNLAGLHPVEPGTVDLALTAPGYAPARTTVEVKPGQLEQVVLQLEKVGPTGGPAPTLDSPLPMAVSLAVAGLGVAVGIGAGVIALDRASDLESRCVDQRCLRRDQDVQDDANTFADVSTIGFVVGGAGLVASGVFFVLSGGLSSSSNTSAARLTPGRRGAGLAWRF